ncbi:ferric reductase [Aspergillus steynii IBT 23096]|uniref:Ferric reductase n=1 Tax=Aspergillus steynii IBT 23096 TaxID=1392250 RepID=A0A2I2FRZ7_9EURO|nr:ferric reductase [Aspergillus steynii IBT 23096]PLB43404.1 ferric reductase [Aspergillus steynii IBT 23096]
MYQPPCAYACRAAITNPLNCSMTSHHGTDMWMVEDSPSPECYATNDAFLQTLAYCLYSRCQESNSTIQKYWETNVAGNAPDQPLPKESYEQALRSITARPKVVVNSSEVLQSVSLIPKEIYDVNWQTLSVFEKIEISHETCAIILLVACALIPILLSFIRFIPLPTSLTTLIDAHILTPPLIGNRHNVPLFNTFTMPTRGQSLFIGYLIAINIILCSVGFSSANPSLWFKSNSEEIAIYVSNRTGVLSFAKIPLLVLFSSRNNLLLWLTDWSHSTFMLLHRWVAGICVLEAGIHALIFLHIYHVSGEHAAESKLPYWYWGILAMLALAIMIPASALPIRRKCYEVFLAWHVVLFLLVMIGSFLHIYYRYAFQWGYENWIYTGLAVWGFERGFRVLRIARNGIRTAYVSVVDDEYIKVEVPGVSAQGHVYLYFPTLTWRVWENHPFSVMTDCFLSAGSPLVPAKDDTQVAMAIDDKHIAQESPFRMDSEDTRYQQGLLIYIRTESGITKYLRNVSRIPVLVESAYHPTSIIGAETRRATNIIAIAGGVGVTALTPILLGHEGWHKLFWAVRSKPLVDSMAESLGADRFDRLNAVVYHQSRMDIPRLLEREVSGCKGAEVVVVVSGPSRMADEVRMVVARLMRDPMVRVRLVEESFSW